MLQLQLPVTLMHKIIGSLFFSGYKLFPAVDFDLSLEISYVTQNLSQQNENKN